MLSCCYENKVKCQYLVWGGQWYFSTFLLLLDKLTGPVFDDVLIPNSLLHVTSSKHFSAFGQSFFSEI